MKSLFLIVFIFLLIISTLVFNLFDANKKIDNYFELNNQIIEISRLHAKLNSQDYDEIESTIFSIQNIFSNILNNNNYNIYKTATFYKKISNIQKDLNTKTQINEKVNLLNEINNLHNIFETYMQNIINNIKNSIITFIVLLVVSMFLFIYYAYNVLKHKIDLDKFKSALDISDNIIIVTDEKHNIKYVNQGFEKTTGYTKDEVIGKNPSILNSGLLDKKFFDNLKSTINNGEKWNGEFINRNKYGKITYEKTSITPIKDQHNKIIEFLAIKLDITKEKEYQNLLTQQSKMVSMGELLENIAHQWRQPLSIISSLSSGMLIQFQYSNPSKEEINSSFEKIFETTQKLSNTIDDLKNFFDKNEEIVAFDVETTIEKAINIFNIKVEFNEIKVEFTKNINCILEGKESEFIQVILNILSNSFDAFKQKKIENKIIKIDTNIENDSLKIIISDNAGGANSNVIDKMFELYFTTKHKAIGTGIGLYMVYQIITYHLKGRVYAKNNESKGISIIIEIPLN